ncbi:unnamed protein product [Enterobius vermicularis]|uniref:LITAF domain-containing protein n=1 Tax=Enterobius vermicularis TaxID=51028 RepID=A0A0N4VMM9_ENTVE|nr:unnamed protein product [Enterobius vermicularis]
MHSLTDFRSTENNRNKLVPCYSLPVSQYLSSPSQSTQHQQLKHHYHQQQQQQQQEKQQQQQEEKQQPQQQLNVQAADSNEVSFFFLAQICPAVIAIHSYLFLLVSLSLSMSSFESISADRSLMSQSLPNHHSIPSIPTPAETVYRYSPTMANCPNCHEYVFTVVRLHPGSLTWLLSALLCLLGNSYIDEHFCYSTTENLDEKPPVVVVVLYHSASKIVRMLNIPVQTVRQYLGNTNFGQPFYCIH